MKNAGMGSSRGGNPSNKIDILILIKACWENIYQFNDILENINKIFI